jgi:two-component system, response regulator PdtaR
MSADVVLLVDDDPSVRDMTCMLLEYAGYGVVLAGSAAEALAQVADHPEIRVVVTDVNLKGGPNGFEMARAMKAAGLDAAVIIISGDPSWQETSHASDMHFLAKPYASAMLIQAVAEGCSHHKRSSGVE